VSEDVVSPEQVKSKMPKKTFNEPDSGKLPFSSAVRAGDFVYTSGHAATEDNNGRELITIEEQTKNTMEGLRDTLKMAGATLDDVIKATIFLRDAKDFRKMNEVYRTFFNNEYPARSTIVTELVIPEILVEIECIAYKPE